MNGVHNYPIGPVNMTKPDLGGLDHARDKVQWERFALLRLTNSMAGCARTPLARQMCKPRTCLPSAELCEDLCKVSSQKTPERTPVNRAGASAALAETGDLLPVLMAELDPEGRARAKAVLCPSALQTLFVCAGERHGNARGNGGDFAHHPVAMPDSRSEGAQICASVIEGALLGMGGRNATVPFEVGLNDVTRAVADTARRWTGKSGLVGKKAWTHACQVHQSAQDFLRDVNARLQASQRELPSSAATAWMLRVAFSDAMPMHQASVRDDLPASAGLGTDEWVRCALGIEQLGDQHWGMRHRDVVSAAKLPATDTPAFTALATSISSLRPSLATLRLRNRLTARGVPTAEAATTPDAQRPA
ncbi:hypothetical protein HUS70_10715 [Pandoraea nosoerga]|uniref:Uncharacterized protein n=1 Tax=Pandoraea nosoerga TaxID=2508296 RepID=A0A5E4WBV1_9BURK|nr:hypothetical protein [Pandoraea nosoerga]MBN4665854.1 hypothetical protein [Pandoraea nosoerga]MBN4676028.1 hypothetical protein [Pandoraea nosoerga]MBN4681899.1 hypothetical protein [Pandoraea nosoerga]MBN4745103.1 hypothetical protein [Pandoraea nosoerga]VVE20575.1 hypothetical protein PNO31109_03108 [Pandoraea nosoerga]